MSIAYLTPIYPMPSATFIRREIAALEAQGFVVHRYAMRRFDGKLVDEADQTEAQRTHALVDAGAFGLTKSLVIGALSWPRKWMKCLGMAIRLGLHSERGLLRHLIYLAEACALRVHLAKCGARHVHAQFGSNAADIALLCHLLGGPPYSITIHGPEDFDAPRPLSLREKVRHAKFVVAISKYTRSQLYRWCDLEDWRKIHVVHCGIDEDSLSLAPVPLPERPRLVNVGRLAEQKGQLLLVEAAALLQSRGLDFELVIVGDGPKRTELERRITQLGLENRVRITGYLANKDVRTELQHARALVLPSFAEGLPIVIMESLAQGRPVISTYIAGIPELVRPGVNGWLVPAGAVEPLADAMDEALRANPADLEQMGLAGAETVAREHDVSIQAKKLADLFGLLPRKSSPRNECLVAE